MVNVSSSVLAYIEDGGIPVMTAAIVQANGTSVLVSEEDFWQDSIEILSGTTQSGEFTVGSAVIGSFRFALNNFTGKFDNVNFVGAVIVPAFTVDNYTLTSKNYYLVSHKVTGDVIFCEAYDAMKLLDNAATSVTYPATPASVIQAVATANGISISGSIPSSAIQLAAPSSTLTDRQKLSYACQVLGCFAVIGHDNKLLIKWYDTSSPYTIPDYQSLNVSTDDVTVTGVTVYPSDADSTTTASQAGTTDYSVVIRDNPNVTTDNAAAVATAVYSRIGGTTFRPGTVSILANPFLEPGDAISITGDNACTMLMTNTTYKLSVWQSVTCDSRANDESDLRPSSAYMTNVAANSAQEIAARALNTTVVNVEIQYAYSTSEDTEPTTGWTTDSLPAQAGKYIWQRAVSTMGNGQQVVSDAACISGADALRIEITSSNGQIFRNTTISTVLTAHVYLGRTEISNVTISQMGTLKWYVDSSTTVTITGSTLTVSNLSSSVPVKYTVRLEDSNSNVLALAAISLSQINDIDSTTYYYQLVDSSASAPAKPTTDPPAAAWTTTEPAYASGKKLYFTVKTAYTDGTFEYTDVSLSSSYTAVNTLDTDLDQEGVYMRLTNNGTAHGIFMDTNTGQLYINMTYLSTGTLKLGGASNGNGTMVVKDENDTTIGGWSNTGLYTSAHYPLSTSTGSYMTTMSFDDTSYFPSSQYDSSNNESLSYYQRTAFSLHGTYDSYGEKYPYQLLTNKYGAFQKIEKYSRGSYQNDYGYIVSYPQDDAGALNYSLKTFSYKISNQIIVPRYSEREYLAPLNIQRSSSGGAYYSQTINARKKYTFYNIVKNGDSYETNDNGYVLRDISERGIEFSAINNGLNDDLTNTTTKSHYPRKLNFNFNTGTPYQNPDLTFSTSLTLTSGSEANLPLISCYALGEFSIGSPSVNEEAGTKTDAILRSESSSYGRRLYFRKYDSTITGSYNESGSTDYTDRSFGGVKRSNRIELTSMSNIRTSGWLVVKFLQNANTSSPCYAEISVTKSSSDTSTVDNVVCSAWGPVVSGEQITLTLAFPAHTGQSYHVSTRRNCTFDSAVLFY